VPVFSIAKTVADCFKYGNKIGLAVALEAFRELGIGVSSRLDMNALISVCAVYDKRYIA